MRWSKEASASSREVEHAAQARGRAPAGTASSSRAGEGSARACEVERGRRQLEPVRWSCWRGRAGAADHGVLAYALPSDDGGHYLGFVNAMR
jgi:hypothetical protein